MSRHGAAVLGVLLAVGAGGCASSGAVQISRVHRPVASADTVRWHDAAILPQPDVSATHRAMRAETAKPPVRRTTETARKTRTPPTPKPSSAAVRGSRPAAPATITEQPRDGAPGLAVLATEPAEAPSQPDLADPFEALFTDAGRVEELDATANAAPGDDTPAREPARPSETAPRVSPPASGPPRRDSSPPRAPIVAPPGGTRPPPATPPAEITPSDDAPASGRAYAVQLHAFPTRPAAEFAARQGGRTLGVGVRVHQVATSSLPFKVLAGHFTTRAAATALRERAVREGFPEAWVIPEPGALNP